MKPDLLKRMMLSLFLVTAFFSFSTFTAQAVESISFTWEGSTSVKNIIVCATSGKTFTVNWGNENNKTFTGTGAPAIYTQQSAYGNTNEYTVVITADSDDCMFTELDVFYRQITSLDVSKAPSLTILVCSSNSLTSLDVSTNTALTYLSCYENSLTSLDVSINTALTYLNCYENSLTSLDVSTNTALTYLSCYSNSLTSLDVSDCTELTSLWCYENSLTSLDISDCTKLTTLSCYSNSLTSLDVSDCTDLTSLWCYSNSLTSLDVSTNTALTYLSCHENSLTSLDVSDCTELTTLSCYTNNLTSLDVSGCTELTSLWCFENSLTSLDISDCTKLTTLSCYSNDLTSLNVSECTELTTLWCHSNSLTSLEVSGCTALIILWCFENDLTNLDISDCTELTTLSCYSNDLTSLDVSGCTELTTLNCDNNALSLQNLKALSEIATISSKNLGEQTLPTEVVNEAGIATPITIDFAFNGIGTVFTVTKNGATALENTDYIINGGTITFLCKGVFKVEMTNPAISSASVTANFIVVSDDATLCALTVSQGTLSPGFAPATTNYSVRVNNSITSLSITATANDANATVVGHGEKILNIGENIFEIVVTAEDGSTTKTYKVTVVRKPADATLSALTVSQGELIPEFSPTVTEYTVNVAYPVTSITVNATVNETGASFDETAVGLKNLEVGDDNVYIIVVKGADGIAEKTYKVTVVRKEASTDATLSELTLSHGTLVPSFNPNITDYTVNVDNSATTISFGTMFSDSGATVTIKKITTPDNTLKQAPANTLRSTSPDAMTLDVGVNLFEITVTAEDGSTRVYMITVIREAAFGLSSDTRLSALWLSDGVMLTPEFKSYIKNYTVTVGSETEEIKINATPSYFKSSVGGTGVKRLILGENTFDITVTAEDGTQDIYTITITREANPVGIETIDSNTITIYPSSITDYFRINGITQPAVVSIYNLQGTALLQRKVEANEQVFVGNLASGIYLIKVDGKTYKVLKK